MQSSFTYAGEAGKSYQEHVHSLPEKGYRIVAEARAKKLQRFVSSDSVVLEFGMGNGWNLAMLNVTEKMGYDVYIDPRINWNKYNIKCISKVEEIPMHYFDIVLCHHVLEHVQNPFDELRLLQQFIKPDGQLVLFVPYEKGKRFDRYNSKDVNHHIYSWNAQSFCNLVLQAGFHIKDCKALTRGYDRFVAALIVKFNIPQRLYYFVRKVLQIIRPDKEIMVIAELK